jgi:putative FmdB family regulatory protein
MPNYGFICEGCDHSFDMLLSISDREKPLKEKCPSCGKKKVSKDYGTMRQALSSDATLNANKATGGKWNELMKRMKNGIPKRYHSNLDTASSRTGRTWLG